MPSFTPIPRPPAVPLLGNIANVDSELPVNSFLLLAKQYGPIFQLVTFGQQVIFVNTQHLSHQVADETKFRKMINLALEEVRNLVGDGLFTARHDEPNWGIARESSILTDKSEYTHKYLL
jgi:cytochrome P450/NADPH-cytochrome P450 reductase